MPQRNEQRIIVALGANQPHQGRTLADTLQAGLVALGDAGLRVVAQSRFFATPCFPAGAGPDYLNAAAVLCAAEGMAAAQVLTLLHSVEAEFGRERVQRWGMRTLDIDLLAMGAAVLPDIKTYREWRDLPAQAQINTAPEQLILPHPRLQDRAFVLVPMADVAPDWRHPVSGKTVREMLETLPQGDIASVKPL